MIIVFRNQIILFNKRRQPRQIDRPHLYVKKDRGLLLEPRNGWMLLKYFALYSIYFKKFSLKFFRLIEKDRRRKVVEFSTAGAALLIILTTGGTFTAATADAPTVLGDRTQSLTIPGYAPKVEAVRDGITAVYNPKTNEATYGVESSDFTNNRGGLVQYPFLRGVPLSDGFGPREKVCENTCEDTIFHYGQDFTPTEGAEIQAIADGVVIQVVNFKENTLNIEGSDNSGGSIAKIEHEIDGIKFVSLYAHLQYDSIPLVKGQTVKLGDLVGKVGNTGKSTGAHLHLGISVNGKDTDPMAFIAQYNNRQWVP